jgi:hypothetical protein
MTSEKHIHDPSFSEWGLNNLVLHYTRLERLPSDKHSSLFVPYVSCSENEVFMGPVTLCYITQAGKACNSSLLGPATSYSENEVL